MKETWEHGAPTFLPRASCWQAAGRGETQEKVRQICPISTPKVRLIAPGNDCISFIMLVILDKAGVPPPFQPLSPAFLGAVLSALVGCGFSRYGCIHRRLGLAVTADRDGVLVLHGWAHARRYGNVRPGSVVPRQESTLLRIEGWRGKQWLEPRSLSPKNVAEHVRSQRRRISRRMA